MQYLTMLTIHFLKFHKTRGRLGLHFCRTNLSNESVDDWRSFSQKQETGKGKLSSQTRFEKNQI